MLYDGNGRPFSSLDSYNVEICRPTPFIGGTTNARGDKDGTDVSHTLFTVTGDVIVRIWGVVTTTLVGAGTIEVGVTGNTAGLIAQVADATTLAASDFYYAATSTKVGATLLSDILGPYIILNGLDILEKVGTADITAGNIYYVCLWRPLSYGKNAADIDVAGNVVAAGTQI